MAEMLNNLEAPSDAELISRVRGGDTDAYGQLFARHVESARRLARQLVRGPDSEDLVSEAFTKVMGAIQGGGGPDLAFRAYLLTAVRRLHVDRIRVQSRLTTSDDLSAFDPGVPFQDTVVEQFESGAAARAFASLPERWQMVLWHLEVERQKPADVAPLLGMTPNSVSALAYRAREGLRQAFLSAHLSEITDTECGWVVEQLGGYVRKGLSTRDAGKVEAHLGDCRSCSGMYLELEEVNSDLRGVIAPLLLGGLAAGYLGATGSGAALGGGLVALLDRAKDYVVAHVVPVSAGTTAAGVAAAVVIVGGVGSGGRTVEPGGAAAAPPSRVSGAQSADAALSEDNTAEDRNESRPKSRPAGSAGAASSSDTGTKPGPSPSEQPPGADGAPADAPPTGSTGEPTTVPGAGTGENPGVDTGESPGEDPGKSSPPKPTPTPEPEGRDVALTVSGTSLSKGIGRFRTHVTNLPTASGPTPLRFQIGFDRDLVNLDSIPHGCSFAGATAVDCVGNGGTYNGLFNADMSELASGESVTITVTVSLPELSDPDPGDNTRSVTLTRTGAGRVIASG